MTSANRPSLLIPQDISRALLASSTQQLPPKATWCDENTSRASAMSNNTGVEYYPPPPPPSPVAWKTSGSYWEVKS